MHITTWLRYLIGECYAILEIASDRRAIWIGALFVLSAGFARDYDGEDLVHEPWHLLLPYAASLITSLVLFSLTYGIARLKRSPGPPFWTAYRKFFGLFWMTAPLAWFYAIPYERFLSPMEATRANLWTLGLVAAWRVWLMIRVVQVLMEYRTWQAVFMVILVADVEACLALMLVPRPIIPLMGGIRMTASDFMLANMSQIATVLAFLSLPIWIIGGLIVAFRCKPWWQVPEVARLDSSKGLMSVAVASVALWFLILPVTQSEQLLRRRVEHDLRNGRITQALAEMSARDQSDFPPHWDPPPRLGWPNERAKLTEIFEAMAESPPAPWVRTIYREKLKNIITPRFAHVSHEDLLRFAQALNKLPEERASIEQLPRAHGRYGPLENLIELLKAEETQSPKPE